jgi:hypothetical protein
MAQLPVAKTLLQQTSAKITREGSNDPAEFLREGTMQLDKLRSKRWEEMTTTQRAGLVVMTTIQVLLLGAALWDLRRRPSEQIRGSKALWSAVVFVNFIGPIAYFVAGRKQA